MKAFVYFNLHRKCYSIKALEGRYKGRVVAHADRVLLRDVTFKVSEAGRQRVLQEKRKNVHAGVVGSLEAFDGDARIECFRLFSGWDKEDVRYARYATAEGQPVTYNPYRWDSFVTTDGPCPMAINSADMAFLTTQGEKRGVWAFDPCRMPA